MEFIKGKWYTNNSWRSNSYCKADGSQIYNKIYFTECIDNGGKHSYKYDWWQTTEGIMREASLEEIQQWLPPNHPDKIKQSDSLVGRYVKTKDGEYLLLTKSQDNGGFYVNNSSRFIDLHYVNNPNDLKEGYELMPEGFNPDTVSKELPIESKFEIGDIIDTDTGGYQYTNMDVWSKDSRYDWKSIKHCNCKTELKKSLKVLNKVFSIYTNSWWYNVTGYLNWISEDCMSKHEEVNPDRVSKELTIDDLVEGEIYKVTTEKFNIIHKFSKYSNSNNYATFQRFLRIEDNYFSSVSNGLTNYPHYVWVAVTPQEKKHLNVCIKQNKFIPQDQLDLYDDNTFELKTVMKQNPFETIVLNSAEELLACEKYFNNLGYRATPSHNTYSNKNTNFIIYHDSKQYQNLTSSSHPKVTLEKYGIIVKLEKEEPKYDYEVVHCTTQEEWDFVTEKLNHKWKKSSSWDNYGEKSCINTLQTTFGSISYYEQKKSKIYLFPEWCNKFGYTMEVKKEEYQVGDWAIVASRGVVGFGEYNYGKHPIKIAEINGDNFRYELDSSKNSCLKGISSYHSLVNLERKALPHEIPNYTVGVDSGKSEEFVLPKKWCFKVTAENYEKFKHLRELFNCTHGYITSMEYLGKSWGIWNDTVYGTEITFEQFQKYVLESKPTQSIQSDEPKTMSKEELIEEAKKKYPIGTKVKCLFNGKVATIKDYTHINHQNGYSEEDKRIWWNCGQLASLVYDCGKWAEIISTPEHTESTLDRLTSKPFKYSVGDKVTVTRDKSRDSQETGFCDKSGNFSQIAGVCGLSGEIKDCKVINGISYYNISSLISGQFIREDVLDILLPEKECTPAPTSKKVFDEKEYLSNPFNKELKIKVKLNKSKTIKLNLS